MLSTSSTPDDNCIVYLGLRKTTGIGKLQMCQCLSHVTRQLLKGATLEDLQATHAALQRALREAPGGGPPAVLPALEASLLALELADGRTLACQVRTPMICFA